MKVDPRIPDVPRDRMAVGVLAKDASRIASSNPGVGRSTTALVASGVISRGAGPGTTGRHQQINRMLITVTLQYFTNGSFIIRNQIDMLYVCLKFVT